MPYATEQFLATVKKVLRAAAFVRNFPVG